VQAGLADRDLVRYVIRILRETSVLRRAMMERRNRLEERIAPHWMIERLGAGPNDDTPMLLAFVARACTTPPLTPGTTTRPTISLAWWMV